MYINEYNRRECSKNYCSLDLSNWQKKLQKLSAQELKMKKLEWVPKEVLRTRMLFKQKVEHN